MGLSCSLLTRLPQSSKVRRKDENEHNMYDCTTAAASLCPHLHSHFIIRNERRLAVAAIASSSTNPSLAPRTHEASKLFCSPCWSDLVAQEPTIFLSSFFHSSAAEHARSYFSRRGDLSPVHSNVSLFSRSPPVTRQRRSGGRGAGPPPWRVPPLTQSPARARRHSPPSASQPPRPL
jgi:hypothetical protein